MDKTHTLHELWETLMHELKARVPSILDSGLDFKFVAAFVDDFHRVDKDGWRFRYPRKRIAVALPDERPADVLGIDYASLLFNLKRAHVILDTPMRQQFFGNCLAQILFLLFDEFPCMFNAVVGRVCYLYVAVDLQGAFKFDAVQKRMCGDAVFTEGQ